LAGCFVRGLEIRHKGAIIAQETHYDPWGLELAGIGRQGLNRFTFNGQSEKQTNLADGKGYFYETDFRSYDATLGRFHAYDLMASRFGGSSPYAFAFNNPISFNDPTGLASDTTKHDGGTLPEIVLSAPRVKGGAADSNGLLQSRQNPFVMPSNPINKPIYTPNLQAPITKTPSTAGKVLRAIVSRGSWLLKGLGRVAGSLVLFILTPSSFGTHDIPPRMDGQPQNALNSAEEYRLNELNKKYNSGETLTWDESAERNYLIDKIPNGFGHLWKNAKAQSSGSKDVRVVESGISAMQTFEFLLKKAGLTNYEVIEGVGYAFTKGDMRIIVRKSQGGPLSGDALDTIEFQEKNSKGKWNNEAKKELRFDTE